MPGLGVAGGVVCGRRRRSMIEGGGKGRVGVKGLQELLIPLEAFYLSKQGMNQLFRTAANVKHRLNPTLKVLRE